MSVLCNRKVCAHACVCEQSDRCKLGKVVYACYSNTWEVSKFRDSLGY